MEYVIEIITNGVLEKVYKFDNRHEAIGAYMRLDSDRKSTRLNSSHSAKSRMPSSA